MRGFILGLLIVAILAPFGVWAVQAAKRQRGGAALLSGLLLIFGLGYPIVPPPAPVAELVVKSEDDDDPESP